MKILITITICLVGTLLATAGVSPAIAKLKKGEQMEVKYTSQGCFHNAKYFFTFKGDKVDIYAPTSEKNDDERLKLGTLLLTKEEISKLDNLFTHYNNGKEKGWSTTQEQVSVKVMIGKTVKLSWGFTDGSGGFDSPKGMMTLGELVARVEK